MTSQEQFLLASLSGGFAGRANALTGEAKEAAKHVPLAGVLVRQAAKKLREASALLDMARRKNR